MKAMYSPKRLFVILIAFAMVFCCINIIPQLSFLGSTVFAEGDVPPLDPSSLDPNKNKTAEAGAYVTKDIDEQGSETNPVSHWSEIKFKLHFSCNTHGQAKTVTEGDYIYMKWPEAGQSNAEITPHNNSFPLKEDKGNGVIVTYAYAYVNQDGVYIVFTDAVDEYEDISGYAEIQGRLTNYESSDTEPSTVTITVNGSSITYYVNPTEGFVPGTKDIDKWGSYDIDEKKIRWDIDINETAAGDFQGNTTILDEFGSEHLYIEEDGVSLIVFKKVGDSFMTVDQYKETLSADDQVIFERELSRHYGSYNSIKNEPIGLLYYGDGIDTDVWTWQHESKRYIAFSFEPSEDRVWHVSEYLSAGSSITPAASGDSISTTLVPEDINDRYLIMTYFTAIQDEGAQGTYTNTATMTRTRPGQPDAEPASGEAKWSSSGGEATGVNYNEIEITKTLGTTSGPKIPGIYFEITKPDQSVVYIVTGSDGIARLEGLSEGTYKIKELTEQKAKDAGYTDASYPEDLEIDPKEYTAIIGSAAGESSGNDLKIVNKRTGNTSLTGTKVWKAPPETFHTNVKLTLVRKSAKTGAQEQIVTEYNPVWDEVTEGDRYTFSDLPKYDDYGYEYTYWVTETQVNGYKEPEYSNTDTTVTDKALNGGFIINTITGTTLISGTKTWDDVNDKDGIRPSSITINLMNGDKQVDSKNVTEDDEWSWSFVDLPKYDEEGKEIKYTITENAVEGYTTEINGYDVTNKHTPEEEPPKDEEEKKPLLSVKKVSKVSNALPGDVIPYVITINNKGDGDAHDVYVIDTMGENLTYVSDDSGGVQDGSKVLWTIDLAAGESKTIIINCRIAEDALGNVYNNVELSGVESEYLEPYENEDTAVLGVYENEKGKTSVKSAKTGDESNVLIWALMMIVSLGAVAAMTIYRKEN